MVQELVQNVIKHASAHEAFIQMSYNDGILNVTVEDDGIGINGIPKSGTGLGLRSIQNRIASLNGTVEVSGDAHTGTSVVLEFGILKSMLRNENVADI